MYDAVLSAKALSDEMGLWEKYTKKEPRPDGAVLATLHDGIMPDGKPCTGLLKAPNRLALVQMWGNYVRRQISERENEQEAQAARRAEALDVGGGDAAPAPRGPERSPEPAQEARPASEESLEALLKSKVASCSRLVASYSSEVEAATQRLNELRAAKREAERERRRAIAALKAIGVVAAEEEDI